MRFYLGSFLKMKIFRHDLEKSGVSDNREFQPWHAGAAGLSPYPLLGTDLLMVGIRSLGHLSAPSHLPDPRLLQLT